MRTCVGGGEEKNSELRLHEGNRSDMKRAWTLGEPKLSRIKAIVVSA